MSDQTPSTPYRVLARKYRPSRFADLIGQDAMVRTLTNAFASGRLAHAFVLTGVRGIGKTTTARIIARALNCVGPDGTAARPSSRAALRTLPRHRRGPPRRRHRDGRGSRTGVDDIRDIIEGVAYRPVMGRYKVYIIDEVHMLSRQAFHALLKTLEEPPEHVKFVFATTESAACRSRAVALPALRPAPRDTGGARPPPFRDRGAGGRAAVEGALRLLVRAADGSVRDGCRCSTRRSRTARPTPARSREDAVRGMLGLADSGASSSCSRR